MTGDRPMASTSQSSPHQSPHLSPPGPSQLRHRPLGRSSTLADVSSPLSRRRSSIFSDSFSEARRSIRSSTDELILPKVNRATADLSMHDDSSHLHSAPLALALLPAVGGLLFTNGSAFVTDITILAIGAILLNWFVKLPWYACPSLTCVVSNDFQGLVPSRSSNPGGGSRRRRCQSSHTGRKQRR